MFLDRFKSDNGKIEFIAIWSNGATTIPEDYAMKTKVENVYFLANIRNDLVYNWLNRAKDIDISEKNYLCLDIDLRKQHEEYHKEKVSDEYIIEFWKSLDGTLIKEHEYLWDYDFIVFSGNGLHIYYIWEARYISPDDYSYAMDRIMHEWDKFWNYPVLNTDKACKNIARILRLPWSYNQKTWKQCFVISERVSTGKLFNSIEDLAKAQKEEVIAKRQQETELKIQEYQKQEKMNRLIKWSKYEEDKEKLHRIFKVIDSIPAYLVAEKINPMFPLSKNWKNFDNEKWGYTGYYYVKDINAIVNGGSQYFCWWDVNSAWSPSNLIKNQFWLSWWETLKYFKDNFNIKI